MKTIILKVQIKVTDEKLPMVEEMINHIETPIQDPYGNTIDHLKTNGFEIMILDRDDK